MRLKNRNSYTDMQKILKISAIFLLSVLTSCDHLEIKSYSLETLNSKQETKLNALLDAEGIYRISMDSVANRLTIKYSDKQTDLAALKSFLTSHNLVREDTGAFVSGVVMKAAAVPDTIDFQKPKRVHKPLIDSSLLKKVEMLDTLPMSKAVEPVEMSFPQIIKSVVDSL